MGVVGVRGIRILGRAGPRLASITAEKKIRWREQADGSCDCRSTYGFLNRWFSSGPLVWELCTV